MLDDATKDVRTPTHELTVAPDVLKSRRRINTQPPGLSAAGLRSLRGRDFVSGSPAASSAADGTVEVTTDPDVDRSTGGGDESNGDVSGSAPSSSPSTRCWPDSMRPIEQATRPGWPALGNEICSSTISTGRGRAAGRMARGAAAGARPAAGAAGNRCARCLECFECPAACALARPRAGRLHPPPGRGHRQCASRRHQSRPRNHARRTAPASRSQFSAACVAHGLIAAGEIALKEHDRLAPAKTMMERS